ncbi:hypothetical protein E1267_40150 [Nonomuraea longispora]|uniref:DAK2 domain-containing protein n=1 Tax=Nonomuraea longispora TaxID=1848320 RepID=A0A4R4MMT8_9ACTN|nr:hypothetical protein E1267_40150 [Nonomuraea longispora]
MRRWARLAADALGQARTEIDALNVFPVADGDTGTNLHLTMLSAATSRAATRSSSAWSDGGTVARGRPRWGFLSASSGRTKCREPFRRASDEGPRPEDRQAAAQRARPGDGR